MRDIVKIRILIIIDRFLEIVVIVVILMVIGNSWK